VHAEVEAALHGTELSDHARALQDASVLDLAEP
jgi:hypothetical protein